MRTLKKISIAGILTSGSYAQWFDPHSPHIEVLFDASSIKHIPLNHARQPLFCHKREDGNRYNVSLTHRVVAEMHKLPAIPWQTRNHVYAMADEVINPGYTQEAYGLIEEASQGHSGD